MTHQAIGEELGLSRPAVSNWMKVAAQGEAQTGT
jgi:predicted transcriptional regulator